MKTTMIILTFLYWSIAVVGLCLLVGGFLAGLHPAGDSLAVGRGWLAVGGLLWFGLGWATGFASPLWLLVPVLVGAPLLWHRFQPQSAGGDMVLYQKNMLYRMADRPGFLGDLRQINADVVTLQEVSLANSTLLDELADLYPTQVSCYYNGRVGDVAVLSRWPAVKGTAHCGKGLAAVQVTHPSRGVFWIVSVHFPWPWPWAQVKSVSAATELLSELDGPIILGGDFNIVPWSRTLRETETAIKGRRAGRVLQTFVWPGKPQVTLPIDHVLLPEGTSGRSETRPLFGSDHLGVVVRF